MKKNVIEVRLMIINILRNLNFKYVHINHFKDTFTHYVMVCEELITKMKENW